MMTDSNDNDNKDDNDGASSPPKSIIAPPLVVPEKAAGTYHKKPPPENGGGVHSSVMLSSNNSDSHLSHLPASVILPGESMRSSLGGSAHHLIQRTNDEKLIFLELEFSPGELKIKFKNNYGGPIIVSHVSKDGKGYGIVAVNDIIIGVNDEDTYDVSNVHDLADLIKTYQSSGMWTLTVMRDMHVRPKTRKNKKVLPYTIIVSSFFMYYESKRSPGATLEYSVNHMKALWIEFQFLTPDEIQQWKDKFRINKLHHNKVQQNPTVSRHGYPKRPSSGYNLCRSNYSNINYGRVTSNEEFNKYWNNLTEEVRQGWSFQAKQQNLMIDQMIDNSAPSEANLISLGADVEAPVMLQNSEVSDDVDAPVTFHTVRARLGDEVYVIQQLSQVRRSERNKCVFAYPDDDDDDSERDTVPQLGPCVRGDQNPDQVADFEVISGHKYSGESSRICYRLKEGDLAGIEIFYMLHCSERPGEMKCGITDYLNNRLYTLDFPSVEKGTAKVRYVKLTSVISKKKIENYVNCNSFFKGYKKDFVGQPITREWVRFEESIVSEIVDIITSINRDLKHTTKFDDSDKIYKIEAGWSTGRKDTGASGWGMYNIRTHPDINDFWENLRRI